MTRGMKGCFIHSTDPETNTYFKAASVGALMPDLGSDTTDDQNLEHEEKPTTPFRVLDDSEVKPYENSVPLFDLKIAAGSFSDEQWLDECQWVELPEHYAPNKDYFVAQVIGESMNRKIPNGSWCLFKANVIGSREGKTVLVQHRDIQDPDTAGQYTIKTYHSEKSKNEDGWKHQKITLKPESNDTSYESIILEEDSTVDLAVIGEFIIIIQE